MDFKAQIRAARIKRRGEEQKGPRVIEGPYYTYVILYDHAAGCPNRYTVHRIMDTGMKKTFVIGRELPIGLALNVIVKDGAKLFKFEEWKKKLVNDKDILGGVTVFPNSRVSVAQIGCLLKHKESVDVILEDYPSLTKKDLEFSKMYMELLDGDL